MESVIQVFEDTVILCLAQFPGVCGISHSLCHCLCYIVSRCLSTPSFSVSHSFQVFVDAVILCCIVSSCLWTLSFSVSHSFQVFVDTVSLFVYTVLHCFQSLWMRRRILLKQSWTLSLSVSHCLQVIVDTFSVSVVLFPVSDDTLGLSVSVALFPGVG